MLSSLNCASVFGVDGLIVRVETDVIFKGLPSFNIVGLADIAVRESRERVSSALKNNGYEFPAAKITINLSPASLKKEGTYFDLPIALGILLSSGQIFSQESLSDCLFLGELSLDGTVRGANGVLPMVMQAKKEGIKNIILAKDNMVEAAIVDGVKIYPTGDLREAIEHISGKKQIKQYKNDEKIFEENSGSSILDFADVKGQENVKRAMEIAAAGAHNLLMSGPPGSGKTMLAKRFPSVLPKMTLEESLEVTKIYSVSGRLEQNKPLITARPFRNPHHTISNASLVGGGRIPMPGEISLAHYGVLFLDELPEFQKAGLEMLRQPLEDKVVNVSRVNASITYPSSFMLLTSMNPCPCGYYGDTRHECRCTPQEVEKYQRKISGPMLDRIDILIKVPTPDYERLNEKSKAGRSSADIRKSVNKARQVQLDRYKNEGILFNSALTPSMIDRYCSLGEKEEKLMKDAFDKLSLSARGYHRILKLARTIADIEESEKIELMHLSEALQYRSL